MNRYLGLLLVFVMIIIWFSIDDSISESKYIEQKKKEDEQILEQYGKSTVDYFNSLDCSNLQYVKRDYSFEKFIALSNERCILTLTPPSFVSNTALLDHTTTNINDADIFFWIESKPGQSYNNYTYGLTAIRNNFDLVVLDIHSKRIIDRKTFVGIGDPPKSISRKQGDHSPEYFGYMSHDQVSEYILSKKK